MKLFYNNKYFKYKEQENKITRTDIINALIKKYNYKIYLEIGVFDSYNFNSIKCETKIGVDPAVDTTFKMTSDDFFIQNTTKFDIIFIDGLHHSDQVYKDIKNSLKFLNEDGIIVLHDCFPPTEYHQMYEYHSGDWNGDCWKSFVRYRYESPYECFVIDTDWGCGVIDTHKQNQIKLNQFIHNDKDMLDLTWQDFIDNKDEWLNIKTIEEFKYEYDL